VLVVELVIVIILQSYVLNWVIFELTELTLGHLEHWQGDLCKNVIDIWFDQLTWILESQTKRDQLDAERKSFGSHKLTSAGKQDADVCLEQNGKVLVSERDTELFVESSSDVSSFVNSLPDLDGLITVGIHLTKALSGLTLGGLLLIGPNKIHIVIVSFKSLMKKINFEK